MSRGAQAVLNFVHKLLGPWFVVWVSAIALAGIMELGMWYALRFVCRVPLAIERNSKR